MTVRTVTPLRPLTPPGYSDTAALDDIHVILTRVAADAGGALAEIAEVVTRTGRPMTPVRDIEVAVTETGRGWPVATTRAGETTVVVCQEPDGPGLLISIATRTAGQAGELTVNLNGQILHPRTPPGGDAA